MASKLFFIFIILSVVIAFISKNPWDALKLMLIFGFFKVLWNLLNEVT